VLFAVLSFIFIICSRGGIFERGTVRRLGSINISMRQNFRTRHKLFAVGSFAFNTRDGFVVQAMPAMPSMMLMGMRPSMDKSRFPCRGCGVAGHWLRDGLCKPEDVAAKIARDYAAYQQAAGQGAAVAEQAG
jgi:hypothetical protein